MSRVSLRFLFMITVKVDLRKDKIRSDGTVNVKIRFTKDRKIRRISTCLFAREQDLTSKFTLKEDSEVNVEAERLVVYYRNEIAKLKLEEKDLDLDRILVCLKAKECQDQPIDFFLFSNEWIDNASIKGKCNYRCAINALKRFVDSETLQISDITVNLIHGFLAFLDKEREERIKLLVEKNSRVPSYRAKSLYLNSLSHLFKEAKLHFNNPELGIIRITYSPFDYVRIPKQEATRKRALSKELILKIYNLPDKPSLRGQKHTNRYNLAKDMFILSFCLIGINSIDIFEAKELVDGNLIYYRAKTKDRRLDNAKMMVNVPTVAKRIIAKYHDPDGNRLFRFYKDYYERSAFNKAINKGLKMVGDELGIDDLEFYAARHSWATIALNKCKIDKYTVHSSLNHLDESMRVTDIYIERDFVNENEANKKVLKWRM